MARRTIKQRKKEKKIVLSLAAVLLLAIFSALMLTVPGFDGWVRATLGVEPTVQAPVAVLDGPVAVHIIDVGQGDAVLLEADGEFALVDAGPPEAADTVVQYIRAAGAESLRYAILTHPHADHYGGMQRVVEQIPVEVVVLPQLDLAPLPTTSLFEDLLNTMKTGGVSAKTAQLGAEYPLGSGSIRVVHAGLATNDNYNLLSLGLLFSAGGMRFLNTGDAETVNENAMLNEGADVAADVFMAGHHGSSTSNSPAFIAAVAPRFVVVSCGRGNSYGHPHATPLQTFADAGSQVLRTDEAGHVVLQPDGSGGIAYAVNRTAAPDTQELDAAA